MYNIFTLAQEWAAKGMDTSKLVTVDIDGKTYVVTGTREDEHEVVLEIPEEGTE